MLYLLATPIGNIKDTSFRAIEILESCHVILCEDTRISMRYISLLNARSMLKNDDFKYISLHSHNEDSRIAELGAEFFKSDIIFMSDAGMPCISDPGAKLVKFAQENNISYTIIPSASAGICAFSMSGFLSQSFSFLSFLPHKKSLKIEMLNKILNTDEIFVCFESTHRILETLDLIANIAPNNEIFAIKEITKIYESYFFGSARDVFNQIKDVNINGEWVIVIKGKSAQDSKKLDKNDILALDIPPKIKAKILSKILNESVETCYQLILEGKK